LVFINQAVFDPQARPSGSQADHIRCRGLKFDSRNFNFVPPVIGKVLSAHEARVNLAQASSGFLIERVIKQLVAKLVRLSRSVVIPNHLTASPSLDIPKNGLQGNRPIPKTIQIESRSQIHRKA
jgi:hypothetical protein